MSTHAAMTDVLTIALEAAVPLRIAELRAMTPYQRQGAIIIWARDAADVVASRGDQLQFRSKPYKDEGGTADTFNHLARGLAALAHCPGGVLFAGRHWCLEHPWGQAAVSMTELTCTAGEPVSAPVERARQIITARVDGEVL